jgi:hypothetical protein
MFPRARRRASQRLLCKPTRLRRSKSLEDSYTIPLSCNDGLVLSPYLDVLTCYYNIQQNCRGCFANSDDTALARNSVFLTM